MADLKSLIADSFSADAAEAWARFVPNEAELRTLAETGRELLSMFPVMPAACVMMSAFYALRLEKVRAAPAYVVAGSLFAGEKRVFGEDRAINGRERFSQSDLSWDGHAWLVTGDLMADVSMFRTAYSKASPPVLAAHVIREFGAGKGLFICRIGDAIKSGLRYEPEYVLTQDQVDALGRGVIAMVTRTPSQ
jgi:hypothetical protein